MVNPECFIFGWVNTSKQRYCISHLLTGIFTLNMGIIQCHVSFQWYMDPVGTGMVFGDQTIHLSDIATFLNHLGIFGWLIFFCNHLLYIKIQRQNNESSNNNLTKQLLYYLHTSPSPNIFCLPFGSLDFFGLVPPFSHTLPTGRQFETTPLWPARRPYGSWTSPGRNPSRWTGFVDWEDPEKKPEYLIAPGPV